MSYIMEQFMYRKKTLGDCNGVPWVTVVQLQKQSPKSSLLWEKEWPRESSQNKATGKMCANVSWQLACHHSLGHVVPVRDEKQLWCHLNDYDHNLLQLQFRLLFYLTCMSLEMKIHLSLIRICECACYFTYLVHLVYHGYEAEEYKRSCENG